MNSGRKLIFKLILVIYFFVAGVFLIAVPWTHLWPLRITDVPWFMALISNPALRGAISGIGLVLIGGAILEIRDVISHKS